MLSFVTASAAVSAQPEPRTEPDVAPGVQEADIADLDLDALLEGDIRVLTVTAVSRRAEKVGEAPASVTVITRDDFSHHGWRSVSEALWSVPGVFVSSARDHPATGVRGISFPGDKDSRVLVLLDGHTLNNPWSGASSSAELLSLPAESIERVEVIRGPSSSIYGSNAFFGVVNIVSRKPSARTPNESTITAGASSLGRYRVVGSTQQRIGQDVEVSAFALGGFGDGPTLRFDGMTRPRENLGSPTPTAGVTSGTDYERGVNAGLLASWRGLSVQARYADRLKGLPSAPADSIFDDPFNSITDVHAFVEARYEQKLAAHTLSARGYYDRFRHRQYLHRDPTDWPVDTWVHLDPRTVSEGNDDTLGAELQGAFSLHPTDTLIAGVEVQRHALSQPTYELDAAGARDEATVAGSFRSDTGEPEALEQTNLAVYLQNDWRPLQNLGVVAGLRFDHNSVFTRYDDAASVGRALAPRAAVIYTPVESTTLKLTYGEAFRNPTTYEAFFDDRASVCGNGGLRPERQRTGELSASFSATKGTNLSGSLFAMAADGLIVREELASCYTGSGPRARFVNAGSILVLGGEAGVDVRMDWLTAFASVTYTQASQRREGQPSHRPPNSPALVGSAGVAAPVFGDKVWLSARARALTARFDHSLSGTVPAYVRFEASAVAPRLLGGLRLQLTGAAGPRYSDPASGPEVISRSIPQDAMEVRADVGYAF